METNEKLWSRKASGNDSLREGTFALGHVMSWKEKIPGRIPSSKPRS